MSRSGMDLKQFNSFMKRCSESYGVRYVTPTIHPKFRIVVSIVIDTDKESIKFNTTNNPDENYSLNNEVNKFLDSLHQTRKESTLWKPTIVMEVNTKS